MLKIFWNLGIRHQLPKLSCKLRRLTHSSSVNCFIYIWISPSFRSALFSQCFGHCHINITYSSRTQQEENQSVQTSRYFLTSSGQTSKFSSLACKSNKIASKSFGSCKSKPSGSESESSQVRTGRSFLKVTITEKRSLSSTRLTHIQ